MFPCTTAASSTTCDALRATTPCPNAIRAYSADSALTHDACARSDSTLRAPLRHGGVAPPPSHRGAPASSIEQYVKTMNIFQVRRRTRGAPVIEPATRAIRRSAFPLSHHLGYAISARPPSIFRRSYPEFTHLVIAHPHPLPLPPHLAPPNWLAPSCAFGSETCTRGRALVRRHLLPRASTPHAPNASDPPYSARSTARARSARAPRAAALPRHRTPTRDRLLRVWRHRGEWDGGDVGCAMCDLVCRYRALNICHPTTRSSPSSTLSTPTFHFLPIADQALVRLKFSPFYALSAAGRSGKGVRAVCPPSPLVRAARSTACDFSGNATLRALALPLLTRRARI
ncbi:hypothetical protein B0H17DRAFT_1206301 [Mycena rosella]|uniref:Uncharacterized protein n=1 Tax=Mycena rosella TaxID=1033263 RepID=A0AAD7G965_MYCRO|nr:hypothetical protein B0H17DRAFT_1206301 [Mycena rosella]